MLMREAENSTRRAVTPGTWQVRRKALLAGIACLPIVLIGYALGVSLITLDGLPDGGAQPWSSAILISGIGGYVLCSALRSLARARAAARGARRMPDRSGRPVA
jgi:hypothetical protein